MAKTSKTQQQKAQVFAVDPSTTACLKSNLDIRRKQFMGDLSCMIAYKTDSSELHAVLHEINKKYDGNIIFNRYEVKGTTIHFTLRCKSSKAAGHKVSHNSEPFGGNARNLVAACWHVHGKFFDALFRLNPKAYIRARKRRIDNTQGNWFDYNEGSIMYPRYASENCNCRN